MVGLDNIATLLHCYNIEPA